MRHPQLDALRGLAATIVVFHHACWASGYGELRPMLAISFDEPMFWLYGTPLRLLVAGPQMVLIFFVLSGFVLTLAMRGVQTYRAYAARRIARVWAPAAVVLLCSALLAAALQARPVPGASDWFNSIWGQELTPGHVAAQVFLLGAASDLDNPIWSIVHELRIALVFPALLAATARSWRWALALAGAGTAVGVTLCASPNVGEAAGQAAMTLVFVPFFIAGAALALHLDWVRERLAGATAAVTVKAWLLALGLLSLGSGQTFRIGTAADAVLLAQSGAGAVLVVALCLCPGRHWPALHGRALQALGRISYSLYLVHVVVFAVVMRLIDGRMGLVAATVLAVALAFPVAWLCERVLERPSIRLGRALAARLDRQAGAAPNGAAAAA